MMIESKMISKSDDVDVGCGDAFGGGDADGPIDTSQMVNNVIDSFQLTEYQMGSQADFKSWIKEYMNAIRTQMKEKGLGKEKIQEFMGKAQGTICSYQIFLICQLSHEPSFVDFNYARNCQIFATEFFRSFS